MIDELLGQLFGEAIFRRYTPSRRTQLLNVGLARKWRWPGVLTVASLVALIAARLVLGP